MNMDFVTTRGPAPDTKDEPTSSGIRYTMLADINKHYTTDGSPRTFHSTVRVKAEDEQAFLRSILPDVREFDEDVSAPLVISPYGISPLRQYLWRKLRRYHAQVHPLHSRARVVDAVVVGGDGYWTKGPSGDLTFRERTSSGTLSTPRDGYVRVGITWKDLPYQVDVSEDDLYNLPYSEIKRYCTFHPPQSKGRNLTISGQQVYYIDDDGSVIMTKPTGSTEPLKVIEPQPRYVPMQQFSITWHMVPRVPIAAQTMRSCVNMRSNMPWPVKIWDTAKVPMDVGTLLYLTYEQSKPYYTVSEEEVYDITYNFLWIASGDDPTYRGHNAAWCGRADIHDFRRVVFGNYSGGAFVPAFDLPRTLVGGADEDRIVVAGHNTYNFADLNNLFRLDGERDYV